LILKQWFINNVFADTNSKFVRSFLDMGIKNIKLFVLSKNGCKDTAKLTFEIFPSPNPNFQINDSVQCFNEQNFEVKSTKNSYQKNWIWSDGTSFKNVDSCQHQFVKYGNYSIKLIETSNENCIDSIEKNIILNPNPIADFDVDTVCFLEYSEFTNNSKIDAGNISKNEWEIENKNYVSKNVSHQFSSHGNFDIKLTVTSDKSCISEIQKSAFVFEKPEADFQLTEKDDSSFGIKISFQNTSKNANDYFWNLSTGETEILESFTRNYLEDTLTLSVRLIAKNIDGCSDTSYQSLFIENPNVMYIPNAFTPNNDGLNTVFKPIGIYNTSEYDMQIYNRWGEIIFQTNNINQGWDGTFRGKTVENGIYIYRIFYRGFNQKQYNYKGNLQLIR